ncbi:unnamed protein product, partial [Nesidiocoris tenuis]
MEYMCNLVKSEYTHIFSASLPTQLPIPESWHISTILSSQFLQNTFRFCDSRDLLTTRRAKELS